MLEHNRISWEIDTLSSAQSNNAPVTRVTWHCDNLPDGLTLSESGQLSGHPTTAGSYACSITVNTNWGTDARVINIRVVE